MLIFYMLGKIILSTRFHCRFLILLPEELNEIRKKLLMQNLHHDNQQNSIIHINGITSSLLQNLSKAYVDSAIFFIKNLH